MKHNPKKFVLKIETANEGNEYQIVSALGVLRREKCKFDLASSNRFLVGSNSMVTHNSAPFGINIINALIRSTMITRQQYNCSVSYVHVCTCLVCLYTFKCHV